KGISKLQQNLDGILVRQLPDSDFSLSVFCWDRSDPAAHAKYYKQLITAKFIISLTKQMKNKR
ncbi:MAG: hypothetical protein K8S16_20385, partial [Bacteroidales bacterium]|nr:hypothetical protein [Bacteroidales bacterium]